MLTAVPIAERGVALLERPALEQGQGSTTDETLETRAKSAQVSVGSQVIPVSFDIVAPALPGDHGTEEAMKELGVFGKAGHQILSTLDPDFVSISNLPLNEPGFRHDKAGIYFDLMRVLPEGNDPAKIVPVLRGGHVDVNAQSFVNQGASTVIASPNNGDGARILRNHRDLQGTIENYGVQIPVTAGRTPAILERLVEPADFAITGPLISAWQYAAIRDRLAKQGIDTPVIPSIQTYDEFEQLDNALERNGGHSPEYARHFPLDVLTNTDLDQQKPYILEYMLKLTMDLVKEGVPGIHFVTNNDVEPYAHLAREIRTAA